ncbi:hypothetical protein ACFP2T_13450 [Plantactinospora solaniradicis]|uniref:DUF2231 domain-containing protein n=1 Tax=Plantactinospora solaniradicis TaxID=1723736 RepID=A0ABW1K8R8_9ACTN
MQPVSVVTGRHPYQVAIHASAIVCGIALVLTDRVPRSAAESMPYPVQVLWVALLVTSGLAALVGAWWRGRFATGLKVELGGVLLLAGGTGMYGVALFAVSGWAAVVAGSFVVGIALGSWWRAAQILRELRHVADAERSLR